MLGILSAWHLRFAGPILWTASYANGVHSAFARGLVANIAIISDLCVMHGRILKGKHNRSQ